VPVSRHQHAQASAGDSGGTVNDNPADLDLTTETGSFSRSAFATSPHGAATGSAGVGSTVDPFNTSVMSMNASASGHLNFPDPPTTGSGSANQDVFVDFPQPLTLREDSQVFTQIGGGFTLLHLEIQNTNSGAFLVNQFYSPNAHIMRNLNFDAARYRFSMSASDFIHIAGSSGGSLLTQFTVVPEPCSALAAIGSGAVLMSGRRHHRRKR
jgi:hypothetical protein